MASSSEPGQFFISAPPWTLRTFFKGAKRGTTNGLKEWELKQCAVLCFDCYIIISAYIEGERTGASLWLLCFELHLLYNNQLCLI